MTVARKFDYFKPLAMLLALAIVTYATEDKITSFKFAYEDIGWGYGDYWEGDIDQDAKTITFTTQKWIENIDRLAAIFEFYGINMVKVGIKSQWSGITQNDFRKEVVYTVGKNEYTVKIVSPQATGLPVIRIDTDDNAPILNREDWVTMTFSMSDPNDPENDILAISNQQIRGRGNSSWVGANFGQYPYRIRFRANEQQSPFGLPAARNWVLLSNATAISKIFGFELGQRLGLEYTCSYNHVELYLNGDYRGIYVFTEHRQADPTEKGAPGRPKIDLKEGWFVEIDRYYDEEPKFRTSSYSLPIMIKTPEDKNDVSMANTLYHFVRDDWNELTDLMNSASFPENAYRDLVDMETFAKYFLVQTVVLNLELHHPYEDPSQVGSTFFYKARY